MPSLVQFTDILGRKDGGQDEDKDKGDGKKKKREKANNESEYTKNKSAPGWIVLIYFNFEL